MFYCIKTVLNKIEGKNKTKSSEKQGNRGYWSDLIHLYCELNEWSLKVFSNFNIDFTEYSALSCAGYLDFHKTIKILKARGEAMQNSVPKGEGGMLAVLGTKIENIEKILKENENNRILRLGMVLSEDGGLIYKINKIFSKLPIIFVPGNGNFKVNFVKVETVIKKFLSNPDKLSKTENVVDLNEKFINFLVTKNKLKLYIPHILTKFILFIF